MPQFTRIILVIQLLWSVSAGASTRLTEIRPALIVKTDSSVVVDIGAVWFAQLDVVAAPSQDGRNIRVVLRESQLPLPVRSDPGDQISVRQHQVELMLRNGVNRVPLGAGDSRLMPEAVGAVMPFRYIEIFGWEGEFSFSTIKVRAAVAETYDKKAEIEFTENSPEAVWLNKIWRLSSHTMAATSFAGVFVDGDRERLPYEADAYINQLGWMIATGDHVVPRRTFEFLIENPNWPTEWQFHMLFLAWEDYMFTGDSTLLRRHYDRLRFLTLHQLQAADGLLSLGQKKAEFDAESRQTYPMADIVDWPPGERDGHEMLPVNTVVNAFAFQAFVIMEKIATELGVEGDRLFFRRCADRVRQGLRESVLSSRGLFFDGVGSNHTSAHSALFPLAFGLVEPSRMPVVLEHLRERSASVGGGFPGSVYAAQYLLEALFSVGEDKWALELMLNPTKRGWRNMLEKYDATITHEAWDPDFKVNEDWTHAWGAAPANIIPRYLVGVVALAPGWGRWRLSPSSALPSAVRAKLPIPQGTIEIELDPPKRRARITVPKKTSCEFVDETGSRILGPGKHVVNWTPRSEKTHGANLQGQNRVRP